MKYSIVIDSRDKKPWHFPPTSNCNGQICHKLDTGDYSIEGMEHIFIIERKGCIAEFAHNIIEKRFERELDRLNKIPHAFVILEFSLEDTLHFPASSDIPKDKWPTLRITPKFILSKLSSFRCRYDNIHFLLVGQQGKLVAEKLMKVVYGQNQKNSI